MGTTREYIDAAAEEILLQHIDRDRYTRDKTKYDAWCARQKQLEAFSAGNQSKSGRDWRQDKVITYDTLNDLLRIDGLCGADFFRMLGVDPVFAEPEYAEIIDLCSRLDESQLHALIDRVDLLATDWQRHPDIAVLQPSERVLTVFERRVPRTSRRSECPAALERAWADGHRYTTIPIRDIPEVCTFLRVSPHWVMRMADDISMYVDGRPQVDCLLDRYSFVSDKLLCMMMIRDFVSQEVSK